MNSLLATLAVVGYFAGVESFPNNGGFRGNGRRYNSVLGGGYGGDFGSMYNNDISDTQSAFSDLTAHDTLQDNDYQAYELSELDTDKYFNGAFNILKAGRNAENLDQSFDENDSIVTEDIKRVDKKSSSSGQTIYNNESDFEETASGALDTANTLSSIDTSAVMDSKLFQENDLSDYSADERELYSDVERSTLADENANFNVNTSF